MDGQYEVLYPWADVDPVPVRGLSPRVTDLTGKTVGLFSNSKRAGGKVLNVVEDRLKKRYPTLKSSWFVDRFVRDTTESEEKDSFEEWLKGVDVAIAAVGD